MYRPIRKPVVSLLFDKNCRLKIEVTLENYDLRFRLNEILWQTFVEIQRRCLIDSHETSFLNVEMSIAQSGFINNLPLSVVGEAGRGMWDANWTFFYQDTGDQVLEYFPSREWKGKVFFFFSFVSSSYHLNIHEYYLEHPSWPIVSVISLISTFRLENTQYDASNGVGDDGDFGNSPMSGSPSLWSADRKPTQDDSAGDWQRSTGRCYIPPNLKPPPPPFIEDGHHYLPPVCRCPF